MGSGHGHGGDGGALPSDPGDYGSGMAGHGPGAHAHPGSFADLDAAVDLANSFGAGAAPGAPIDFAPAQPPVASPDPGMGMPGHSHSMGHSPEYAVHAPGGDEVATDAEQFLAHADGSDAPADHDLADDDGIG
jgi:hypothetical protein